MKNKHSTFEPFRTSCEEEFIILNDAIAIDVILDPQDVNKTLLHPFHETKEELLVQCL